MKNYKINDLVDEYLGNLFRQQSKWIKILLKPLSSLWDAYLVGRQIAYKTANITSQVISLQNVLNDLFDPMARRIEVYSNFVDIGGKFLAKESEANPVWELGTIAEDPGIWLGTEMEELRTYDFIVSIPTHIQKKQQIKHYIDKFKLAGKSYQMN